MAILRFLLRSAGPAAFVMALLSASTGAFNAGLVAVVHQTLVHGASALLLAAFFGLGLGRIVTGYYSGVLVTRYSHESITALRRELIEKLLSVPYARFERMGRERVLAALTEDIATLNSALQILPGFVLNLAIVAGGACYLSYLSLPTFLVLSVVGALGALAYGKLGASARRHFTRVRDLHERLLKHLRALTDGTKELKQHAGRRRAFLEREVRGTSDGLLEHNLLAQARFQLAQAGSSFTSLLIVGAVLFLMPRWTGMSQAALSGYVLTALYLTGPVGAVVRVFPFFATAEIARKRIDEIANELGRDAREQIAGETHSTLSRVQLHEVTHHYESERGETRFTLGPVSLELAPGELVFITGENGSGKSTLAKLLIGLYSPEQGELRWNGERVDDHNRDAYRQLFSVVHADFFLFESLLGLGAADGGMDQLATELLRKLELDAHVTVQDGVVSSLKLSQGQRRRLALLTAYLEDRPIYVFDEWAADQDPAFKEVFYRQLLPELRARGKAVVVITHDDRYFDLADRTVKLSKGRAVTT
ncbi:MAG TPA: cyclic peptide export ABC transporter [Polyangiales bacterium]|jgi:putative ATP-binding cassette transporter|nr:cyclic peptide export ABC transporter [Polyangiales bacterium]